MTSKEAQKKYGIPGGSNEGKYMEVWMVPQDILDEFPHVFFSAAGGTGFPKKIYINKDFKPFVERGLRNVIERGLTEELKTWDGCYIVRSKRLSTSYSMHSWGLAIDVNASENRQGTQGSMSKEFAQCFIDAGCEWGGNWEPLRIKDPMHIQIK